MKTKHTVKELWTLACKHDSIDQSATFVVFSDDNPWIDKYNRAMGLVLKYRQMTKV